MLRCSWWGSSIAGFFRANHFDQRSCLFYSVTLLWSNKRYALPHQKERRAVDARRAAAARVTPDWALKRTKEVYPAVNEYRAVLV